MMDVKLHWMDQMDKLEIRSFNETDEKYNLKANSSKVEQCFGLVLYNSKNIASFKIHDNTKMKAENYFQLLERHILSDKSYKQGLY